MVEPKNILDVALPLHDIINVTIEFIPKPEDQEKP